MEIYCGRCKNVIKDDDIFNSYFGTFKVDRIRIGNQETHLDVMRLCPNCAQGFINWWEEIDNGEKV